MVEGVSSPPSRCPDHADLDVRRVFGRAIRVRRTYVVPNLAPRNDKCVYNNDIVTLERALKERVFYVEEAGQWIPAPQPRAKVVDLRLRRFEDLLAPHLPSTTPMSRNDFAMSYRGRKQVVYLKAAESLMTKGISARDFRIKAFVKAEKGKAGSTPRVIQPRDPRCNVEIGKFLKPLEERVFRAIARVFGETTVMKGYTAEEVGRILAGKWVGFKNPVAVGLDAKRFDQHVSVDILRWEHRQYVRCFRNPRDRAELSWLLSNQLLNQGTGFCSDGVLRYRVRGKRMSGDMNTSLGNCLIMCAMVFAYAEQLGIPVKLANNGDDCVVFMESTDVARFSKGLDSWFRAMGFRMEVEEPAYDLPKVEFCQARPIFDGATWTMVRNLVAFDKDAHCLLPIASETIMKYWLEAVGMGGLSLAGGIPIWQEYYSCFLRSGRMMRRTRRRRGKIKVSDQPAFESGLLWACRGSRRGYGPVSDEARFSFWVAFGITPDHQVALEEQYRRAPPIEYDRSALEKPEYPTIMSGFLSVFSEWSA